MDDYRLSRIEVKLDDTNDHLSRIDKTLTEQHVVLEHHVQRTNDLQTIVEAVTRKVTLAEGGLKLLGVLLVIFEIVRFTLK